MANNDPRQVSDLDVVSSLTANDKVVVVEVANGHVGIISMENLLDNAPTITVDELTANAATITTLTVETTEANTANVNDLTVVNVTATTLTVAASETTTANVTTLTVTTEVVNTSAIVILQVNNILVQNLYTPTDSTSDAIAGAFWSDGNYVYFAVANGSIKRAELLSF